MYKISAIEFKQSAAGNAYARVKFEGNDNEVAIFSKFPGFGELKVGSTVEGELTSKDFNGKKSYTLNSLSKPSTFKAGGANIAKAQEVKAKNIGEAMDRKEASIEKMATFRDATILTSAWMAAAEKNGIEIDINLIKSKWTDFRDWLTGQLEEPPF